MVAVLPVPWETGYLNATLTLRAAVIDDRDAVRAVLLPRGELPVVGDSIPSLARAARDDWQVAADGKASGRGGESEGMR